LFLAADPLRILQRGFTIVADALFERLYQAEWDRKNALQGDTSLPLGILALLGSGLVVILKEYDGDGGLLDVLFWGGFTCASLAYSVAIYMLVRSFYGYVYQHLPFSSALQRYRDGLREHHREAGTPYLAEREFEQYLEQNLVNAADRNMAHNLNRSTFLHRTNSAIVVTFVAVAFTSVPYSIRERTQAPPPQRVEITRIPGAAMPQSVSPGPQAATPAVPPKPVPPSNFDVKGIVRAPTPRTLPMRPGPVPPSNFDVKGLVRAPAPLTPSVPRNPLEPKNFDETAGVRAPKPK
jgi:hypothetical protein